MRGGEPKLSPADPRHPRAMDKLQRFLTSVDETLCKYVVCQHPPCWETMRRLERGFPRISLQSEPKLPLESEGDLPLLHILDLPQWSADQGIDVSIVPLTSRKTPASSQSYKLSPHPDNLQSASLLGTSRESSLDFMQFTRSCSCSPLTRDRLVDLRKVEVMELNQQTSSCDQYLGKNIFIWVPNLQNKRKWQKEHAYSIVTPQSVSVKEISFQGQPYDELVGLSVEQKQRQKNKKAKKKTANEWHPYTYLARNQQRLKGWKDTLHSLNKEHRNELPEIMEGFLTQPYNSDHVTEQILTQQYCSTKSQSLFNHYEDQGARKIPAHVMLIPVSKKITLHHFNEKQKQAQSTLHSRGSHRMDAQHLKVRSLDINHLKIQTYFDNNLSVIKENTDSDPDYRHPPSPVLSTNGVDPIDTLNTKRDTHSIIMVNKFLMAEPGSQETGSSSLTTSVYSQENNILTIPTAEVQNTKWTKMGTSTTEQAGFKDQHSSPADNQKEQQDLITATEITPPIEGQEGSEDQRAISIDKQDQQQDLSTATEVRPSFVEKAGSEDQSTIPFDKMDQQQDLSTATEVRPSFVEKAGSEDQSTTPIDKMDQQQDLSIATEVKPQIMKQMGSEIKNKFLIAKENELQDLSTVTDVGPPTVEQGNFENQNSFPTVERNELQETKWVDTEDQNTVITDLSPATEMQIPIIDQGINDQNDLPVTERNEQHDLGVATESTVLI
ncbi:uncharacterized protein LOC132407590 [Hypanus sabinus]|uniref:uncharacterized protein LOC132407590 n=1 Tax=Hypanus sabinus TaxID=79690 RepID=UPI0028C424A1|nr:uncharacterized protein LOC132407590 [Hypanus sabinus]